jgi:hypothetical protein
VFEGIDAADEPTVESLVHILQRPGWLRLPLLLTIRDRPQGRAAELINLIRQTSHNEGITEMGVDVPAPRRRPPLRGNRCRPTRFACCGLGLSVGQHLKQSWSPDCSMSRSRLCWNGCRRPRMWALRRLTGGTRGSRCLPKPLSCSEVECCRHSSTSGTRDSVRCSAADG